MYVLYVLLFFLANTTSLNMSHFEVYVSTPELKFNCAHFIAFKGFRERLHGHNYTMGVRVIGQETIGEDGYVIDFGDIKKSARAICQSLNESFICPMLSDAMKVSEVDNQICMQCEDGASFSIPTGDCSKLPIYHSSAEEMAHYIWCRIIRSLGIEALIQRGVTTVEVGISEAPFQTAFFRSVIPSTVEALTAMETSRIKRTPTPCSSS